MEYTYFTYTYTDKELNRVYVYPMITGAMFCIFGIFALIYSILYSYKAMALPITLLSAAFTLFVIWGIYQLMKFSIKTYSYFKAEQKVYFKDDLIYYESGEYVTSVEVRYITKIKQTKNFYRIDIPTDKAGYPYFQGHKILMSPHIPRRITYEKEMMELASALKVEYSKSFFK